jgi:hypothetical protein
MPAAQIPTSFQMSVSLLLKSSPCGAVADHRVVLISRSLELLYCTARISNEDGEASSGVLYYIVL